MDLLTYSHSKIIKTWSQVIVFMLTCTAFLKVANYLTTVNYESEIFMNLTAGLNVMICEHLTAVSYDHEVIKLAYFLTVVKMTFKF
jgi:hypothetical protein